MTSRFLAVIFSSSAVSPLNYAKSTDRIKKRLRKLNEKSVRQKAKYVLCWLQQNIRANDNPIIDGAIATSNKLKLPIVVYHGLGQRYPHASDRLHQFIVEASRSLAPGPVIARAWQFAGEEVQFVPEKGRRVKESFGRAKKTSKPNV